MKGTARANYGQEAELHDNRARERESSIILNGFPNNEKE